RRAASAEDCRQQPGQDDPAVTQLVRQRADEQPSEGGHEEGGRRHLPEHRDRRIDVTADCRQKRAEREAVEQPDERGERQGSEHAALEPGRAARRQRCSLVPGNLHARILAAAIDEQHPPGGHWNPGGCLSLERPRGAWRPTRRYDPQTAMARRLTVRSVPLTAVTSQPVTRPLTMSTFGALNRMSTPGGTRSCPPPVAIVSRGQVAITEPKSPA